MGTHQFGKKSGCRVVVGPEETAAARAAWPDAPVVALVEASEPGQAVLARCAGADVVVPTADLAAGWRDDTPGLEIAVSAATALAEQRVGRSDAARRSAHDLGQALSAINLATELAIGEEHKNDRLLDQIRGQTQDAGIQAWRAARPGRSSPCPLGPVDLSSLLHRVATDEPDVSVYDSTAGARVLGDESTLEKLLEDLVQEVRRTATTQRIEVRFGPGATVEITFAGIGRRRPLEASSDAEGDGENDEFGMLAMGEIANDLGGRLEAEPAIALALPLLPDGGSGSGLVQVPPDRMAIQTEILEGVLRHVPLTESLEAIVAAIEQQLPGTMCSVLLLDERGCLNHGAGAGLPEAYRREIDGVAIGYGQGSCGTAAFLGRAVVAPDVETDDHWISFRHVALEHGLRSCWSTPILAADGGAVLGTFAVYRSEVWEPDDAAARLVSRFTYLAAVAIGHHRLFRAVADSESRFRGAFEGATAGMALVALDGSFLMVNPALCAMLGADPPTLSGDDMFGGNVFGGNVFGGNVFGGNVFDLVDPAHRDVVADDWAALLASSDRSREPTEVPFVAPPGGEPLWVSMRSSLVAADESQAPYVYLEIRDVTASRRHAVERRAREAAEAASRAKSDLLAFVSHELRTPLNAILGFAQVMQLIELDAAQQAKSVENIMTAGRHLLELINELLDLSLIEAGQLSTSVEDIDAGDIIDEALQIVQPLADSRGITLRRELSATLARSAAVALPGRADRPAILHADRQCVRQVLINLVGNAVKFTPSGGEVGIIVGAAADDAVRLNVIDSGPGIPAEAIGDLFQPFHRLVGGGDAEAEGTGLGLSVAARLVAEMGGRIGVESSPGTGSCFWVDLPGFVCSADAPPHDAVPSGGHDQALISSPKRKMTPTGTVLHVEDDPACAQVMSAVLALRPGVRLLTARTMADASAILGSQRIDGILLDIGLPDGSGWDLLRELRAEPDTEPIPVLVLTAGPGAVPSETPLPDAVMTKPLDLTTCIESIDRLLAQSP